MYDVLPRNCSCSRVVIRAVHQDNVPRSEFRVQLNPTGSAPAKKGMWAERINQGTTKYLEHVTRDTT